MRQDLKNRFLSVKNGLVIAAIVIAIVLLKIFVPTFWTFRNIVNIFVSGSTVGILAVGISLVLAGAGLDISLPSVMALSAVVGSKLMVATQNVFLGIMGMVIVALVFGVINGISCAVFKMYPFIVTMSTMILAQGVNSVISKSVSVSGMPASFIKIFNGKIAYVPIPIFVLFIVVIVGYLILNKSMLGRKLFAIGVNEKTAEVCGIDVAKIKFISYVLASLSAAIAAVVLTARLKSASAMMASDNMNLDVLAVAVIGGVSMQGGTGNILGVFAGTLLISGLSNLMNLMNITTFPAMVVKGCIVLLVTYLDATRGRRNPNV